MSQKQILTDLTKTATVDEIVSIGMSIGSEWRQWRAGAIGEHYTKLTTQQLIDLQNGEIKDLTVEHSSEVEHVPVEASSIPIKDV